MFFSTNGLRYFSKFASKLTKKLHFLLPNRCFLYLIKSIRLFIVPSICKQSQMQQQPRATQNSFRIDFEFPNSRIVHDSDQLELETQILGNNYNFKICANIQQQAEI